MQHAAHTGFAACGGHLLRKTHVRILKTRVATTAMQNTDQVDHRIATADQFFKCRRVVHIRGDGFAGGQHGQMLGEVARASGRAQSQAARRQRGAHLAADEAGAAENTYSSHGFLKA